MESQTQKAVRNKDKIMTKSGRIGYLDMAKGIGMLLVVIGHAEYVSAPIRQYIVSFHMPLFFLISGMLIWYKDEEHREWPELISKKICGLMVPYAIFSLLYFVIESSRLLIKGLEGWGNIFRSLYQSVVLQGVSALWFLPALFLGELIFIWIRKNSNHTQTLWCLAALFISIYFINIDVQAFFLARSDKLVLSLLYDIISMLIRSFFCAGLVGLGYYAGSILLKRQFPIVAEAAVGVVLMIVVGFVAGLNSGTDLRGMNLGNLGWFLLCGVTGALGVIILCRVLSELPLKPLHRLFAYFGRNSLLIMATHIDFRILYVSIKVAEVINAVINNNVIFCILIVLFVFLAEIVVIEFVNRVLPMIFKKRVKSS